MTQLAVPDNFAEISLSQEARSLFIDLVMEFNNPENDHDTKSQPEQSRTRKKRRARKADAIPRFMGQKNAAHIWGIQTKPGAQMRVILTMLLLLGLIFAAPSGHILILKPQLEANARKIEDIARFQRTTQADVQAANLVLNKIKRIKQASARFMVNLHRQGHHDVLIQSYLAALERFGIAVGMFEISPDAASNKTLAAQGVSVQIVNLELQGRFDVYRDIRNIFMREARHVTLLEEKITILPQTSEVKIKSRFMLAAKHKGEAR